MEELEGFIKSKREEGVADSDIKAVLMEQGGWTQEDLDNAFGVIQSTTEIKVKKTSKWFKYWYVIPVLLILASAYLTWPIFLGGNELGTIMYEKFGLYRDSSAIRLFAAAIVIIQFKIIVINVGLKEAASLWKGGEKGRATIFIGGFLMVFIVILLIERFIANMIGIMGWAN